MEAGYGHKMYIIHCSSVVFFTLLLYLVGSPGAQGKRKPTGRDGQAGSRGLTGTPEDLSGHLDLLALEEREIRD